MDKKFRLNLEQFVAARPAQLAVLTGIDANSWTHYDAGRHSMTLRRLESVAQALGMDTDLLIEGIAQRVTRNKKSRELQGQIDGLISAAKKAGVSC